MNKLQNWLMTGDTGTSSLTIVYVMEGMITTPARCNHRIDVPHDPADFGRCHALLQLFPDWRSNLVKMGAALPKWRPMVAAWAELERLYESGDRHTLYLRLLQLEVQGHALEVEEVAL